MSVLITLIAAITTTALGLAGGILLGTGCVRWYGISSFEGGSGYFVMFIGLFGGIAGLIVGLATALYCLLAGTKFEGWSSVLVAWGVAFAILLVASRLCAMEMTGVDLVTTSGTLELQRVSAADLLKFIRALGREPIRLAFDAAGAPSRIEPDAAPAHVQS